LPNGAAPGIPAPIPSAPGDPVGRPGGSGAGLHGSGSAGSAADCLLGDDTEPRLFGSLKQLIQTIERYIENWNTDCEPFVWTATSGGILAKVSFIESEVRRMLDCNAQ
jgi:hypothetical protein